MGHDLIAKNYDTEEYIASLRISGEARRKTNIYTALKAEEHNNLDSGDGGWMFYTVDQIRDILNRNSDKLQKFEVAFLEQILLFAKGKDIIILFE